MSLGSILPTLYSTDFYETWQQSWSSVPLESRERSLDPSFFPDLTVIRHTQNTAVDVNLYRLGTLETGLYSTLFSRIILGLWFLANVCEVVWLYLFQMCPEGKISVTLVEENLTDFSKHGSLWKLTLCNLLMRELTIGLAIVSWPESINSASSTVEITQYGYSIVWRICLSVQMKHLAPLTTSSKFGVFLYVSVCIHMYLYVYICLCMYT